jgi:hypothetical protein
MSENDNENVFFLLDETENSNEMSNFSDDFDFTNEMNDLNNEGIIEVISLDYKLNYTVKELLLICEYYGIAKELKVHKCCKDIIIQFLVDFESITSNNTIVLRRQEMWRCINILKNDKFMKKYVLW